MLKVMVPPWVILGVYRGINEYSNDYKKEYKIYEQNPKYYPKPQYFYLLNIPYGFYGAIMYCNPIIFPIIISKEIYRLEVNIRGLNEEKEKEDYNNII